VSQQRLALAAVDRARAKWDGDAARRGEGSGMHFGGRRRRLFTSMHGHIGQINAVHPADHGPGGSPFRTGGGGSLGDRRGGFRWTSTGRIGWA
jgi:hypothetical protein